MEKTTTPQTFLGGNGKITQGFSVETIQTDETVSLTEGRDVPQESIKYQGLVAHVKERFSRSKNARLNDERRWLSAYRNFRGLYGPDVQFTDTEKSRAFVKVTKTKVLAAYAQMVDILFAGNKFPIGVEASKVPEGVADSVHVDPKAPLPPTDQAPAGSPTIARPEIAEALGSLKKKLDPVKDKVQEGPGLTPTSYTWEPAKIAAKKMELKFQDQFAEAHGEKTLRAFTFELALLGHGIVKGPFAKDKEYARWSGEGEYTPDIKQVADFSSVSIWNAYPDPDARSMDDCEYFIERHKMTKTQLRALKKRPFFREESIELAISDGFSYIEEYWEAALHDHKVTNGIERFEVLEYWGTADRDFIEVADIEIPEQFKGKDQVQVNIWICNDHLLRVVFNPYTPSRIPYHACPYELNPYSFFGIGVAENMSDTQLIMNGAFRSAIDNAVLSSNLVLEINETVLAPGQDMKLYPGKIFRTEGQLGQAIHSIDFNNTTQEWNMLFDKARQLADEATGIPSYSHGQGGVQGIGRTASGMSMLMGAAAQNIKAVVRNIDDYLLVPLGKMLFAFNMQFDFDKDYTMGDIEVVARGTESLMRDEIRSQKILQFMQMTANPMDAPFVKRDYLLRELAQTLELEPDKVVNDPREAGIQALQMQEMMKAQGIDPNKANQNMAPGGGGSISDPTQQGPGQPGAAPEPGAEGFSGGGGGSANAANVNKAKAGR